MATEKRILLCQPRGFCAGVERAVQIIDELVRRSGETVYVRKEVVHNRVVVEEFRRRGVIFVDEVEDAPESALLVFSAHGIAPAVRERAEKREQRTIDAVCPLVVKVHREVSKFVSQGYHVLLIGHAGHEEVDGTMGHAGGHVSLIQNEAEAETYQPPPGKTLGLVSQTTLAVSEVDHIIDILQRRFPGIHLPAKSDVCYATENRQVAVRAMAPSCDAILVIGSDNSSNSRSLRDAAADGGKRPAYLLDDPASIKPEWLTGVTTLGITAGASTPETLVADVIARVRELDPGFVTVEPVGTGEPAMTFLPPRELAELLSAVD
ncbi:MAG: 4-hydroxy-3-methylbut-2-enyl diphosphate reductase [Candidatus Lustribacter sp.]